MTNQQPVFNIEKLYIKDLSLEVPQTPQIFMETAMPHIDVHLENDAKDIGNHRYEATVLIRVTASLADKTYFIVEVVQGGLFMIQHIPDEQMDPVLKITCPNILFPYAREVISDLTVKAGFPPVLLNPISFESLYMNQQPVQGNA
jgi:preprotein translocase subunit SecB